jgi:hypothetical protein
MRIPAIKTFLENQFRFLASGVQFAVDARQITFA